MTIGHQILRHDVRLEKEIFWLTFTNVEQIRKEILKLFASSPYFLKTGIKRKCFIKITG